jgi:GT2 family glycosyltransferase
MDPDRNAKTFRRSLAGFAWALKTIAQKRLIALQDRWGGYSYARWIKEVERPALCRAAEEARRANDAVRAPQAGHPVCFLLIVGRGEWHQARETVETILALDAPNIVVRLLAPQDLPAGEENALRALVVQDGRFSLARCPAPTDPSNWPVALVGSPCGWVVPIHAGDRIAPGWADLFHAALRRTPDVDLVYWDEDCITERGRSEPFFKPDWSPELLLHINYLQTAAFRSRLLPGVAAAGMGWPFAAAAGRIVHIPFVLQHRAQRRAGDLSHESTDARRFWASQAREALERRGFAGVHVDATTLRLTWEITYPAVSVIIPTRDNLEYLRRCLSTLLEKTDYPAYEVILLDDHSSEPAVLAYYEQIQAAFPNVRVYANEEPFNYSRVNNHGAALAKGPLLLFLNNDVEILEPGWLKEMARWALQPGVGMVGAKLLYPDGTIQHSGIVVGMTGHAAHLYQGLASPLRRFFPSQEVARNVSAVTGACMMVRRDAFAAVGGFDETLGLVFNDVELGVRFLRAGWRVVYTPGAVLIHYEGRSRARYIPAEDIRLGAERLGTFICQGDPYYNPNLSMAVAWPTLRRPFEPKPADRLADIVRRKGEKRRSRV